LETVINVGGALFLLFESEQSIQVLNFVHEQFISTFIDLAMMGLTACLMCYRSDNETEECSKRESFVFASERPLIQLKLFQECQAKFQSIPKTIPVDPLAEGGHPSVNSVLVRGTSDTPTDDADLTFVDHQRATAISLRFINSTMNGVEGRSEDNEINLHCKHLCPARKHKPCDQLYRQVPGCRNFVDSPLGF
jgi:hypothetical protein